MASRDGPIGVFRHEKKKEPLLQTTARSLPSSSTILKKHKGDAPEPSVNEIFFQYMTVAFFMIAIIVAWLT